MKRVTTNPYWVVAFGEDGETITVTFMEGEEENARGMYVELAVSGVDDFIDALKEHRDAIVARSKKRSH